MNSMTGSSGPTGSLKRDIIPKGYNKGRLANYTPEQMQLFQQSASNLGPESYLSRLAAGDEEIFNEIEAPALRQHSELQGGLASRFSGAGMGSRRSSGFQNTSSAAASNFAQQLQSQRQSLRQKAVQDLMGYTDQFLNQRPYDQFLVEKPQKPEKKGLGGFGGILGAGLGGAAGFFAGGPAGALAGSQIGSSALSGM